MTISSTYYARGDSPTANNAALNPEGTNTTATAEIYFESGVLGADTTGNIELDYNGGLADSDTTVWIDGVEHTFTMEFSGTLPFTNPLSNVNGFDLRGESIIVITDDTGQRWFFLPDNPDATFLTMDDFPNGAAAIENYNETGPTVLICFTRGTRIRGEHGDILVEDLRAGDMVVTASGIARKVNWVGKRNLSALELKRNPQFGPVRIQAGALAQNAPSTDLVVSQQHRMLLENWQVELMFGNKSALAAAKHLVNDHSIMFETPADGVEYYHVLFDQHEIIYANDALTESFHPGQWALDGLAKETRAEIFALFPELENDAKNYGATAQPVLKAAEVAAISALN